MPKMDGWKEYIMTGIYNVLDFDESCIIRFIKRFIKFINNYNDKTFSKIDY